MLEKVYYYVRRRTSLPEEKDEYSAGYWEGCIRLAVRDMCRQSRGKLLEVGCGEGLFLRRLADEGTEIKLFGIDNNFGRIRQAQEKSDGRVPHSMRVFIQGDGRKLPFDDYSFETVVCVNVFLNLPGFQTVEQLLEEMIRVCKPGGRIIFDYRNSRNMLVWLKFKSARFYDKTIPGLPLRAYPSERIRSFLMARGLKAFREKHMGFSLFRSAPIIIVEAYL